MPKVSDPALLEQLNGSAPPATKRKVSDPALLAQLNSPVESAPPAAPQQPNFIDMAMRSNPLTSGLAQGADALHLNQGVAGVNEGIADTLSLPNTLVKAAFNAAPTISRALGGSTPDVGALDMLPDAGKAYSQIIDAIGAGQPEATSPIDKIIRSTGRATGGAIIPEAGLVGGTADIATILRGLLPAASSGASQGIAQVVAPDNPMAQLLAAVFGGFAPTTMKAGVAKVLDKSSGFETAAGQPVPKKLVQAVERDAVAPPDVGQAVAGLGPAATVADVGDNTQKLAAAIATQPGEAGAKITTAMKDRAKDSTTRVPAAVDSTLGPATPPSEIKADIKANMKQIGPEYDPILGAAPPVDPTPIAAALDAKIATLKGPARGALQEVRNMLNVAGANAGDVLDRLDTSARGLFETRNAIDGMINPTGNSKVNGVLSDVRRQIDEMLSTAVPGIKEIDAKYHELGRQDRAVDAGGAVLDGGKGAVWPQENATAVAEGTQPHGSLVGPSASAFRLSQGARADIERIIGTKVNDRVALAQMVQGESDWNAQKLAQLFGQDKADKLMQIVQQERRLAETENLAVNGSKTAAVSAAQKDLSVSPVTPSAARGRTIVDAAFEVADAVTRHAMSKGRAKEASAIADAILGNGDWSKVDRPFLTPEQQAALTAAATSIASQQ